VSLPHTEHELHTPRSKIHARRRRRLLLVALGLAAVVAAIPGATPAQTPALVDAREASDPDAARLGELLRVLEDPESARRFTENLRTLLQAEEAQKRAASETATEPEDGGLPGSLTTLLESYERYRDEARSALSRLTREMRDLGSQVERWREDLSSRERRRALIVLSIQFGLALLVGVGAWLALRRATRRWNENLSGKEEDRLGRKLVRNGLSALLHFYPWAGLLLFALIFFLFVPHVERVRRVVWLSLLVLGLYSSLQTLLAGWLSPGKPAVRILPVRDESAVYAYVWCRRVLQFILTTVLLMLPGVVYDLPSWTSGVEVVLKIGLLAMLAVVLAQQKGGIQRVLRLAVREEDSIWKARSKRIAGAILGRLYLLAIACLGLLVAFSLLGFQDVFRYVIRSAAKTLLIALLATGAFLLWRVLFRRFFAVNRMLRERFPELEPQVNRYVNLLQGAGSLGILLVTFLSVLEAWGLTVYAFLHAHGALVKVFVEIPIIVAVAVFVIQLGRILIVGLQDEMARRMLEARGSGSGEVEKRVGTLGRICRSFLSLATISLAAMMVLERVGVDIKPLLAGAGIVGLAVGFGAQNLVKDVISGLFFIVENRLRVGDVAILNGTGGLVEQVNLRTTVLRGLDGTVHVFPNGSITSLSNMTHEFSYYLFNIGVAYKEDTDRVVSVLKAVGEEMLQDDAYSEFILEPLEILGVDTFGDSAVVIKARIKTVPIKQWLVGREMNRRIKKRFDEEGIEIPFPHRTVYFGDRSTSVGPLLKGRAEEDREALKGLLRELLHERVQPPAQESS